MNSEYEIIVWSDAFSVGVAVVDEQHQILVNMLNMAAEQLTNSSGRVQIQEIIRDLMSYALYHFDTEEELMVEHDFPSIDREKHFQEHRSFSATVSLLQQDLNEGKLVGRDTLLGFLKDWLIHHIQGTDKHLGNFLCQSDST